MTSQVKPAAAVLLLTAPCNAGSTSAFCDLNSVLHVLSIAAAILAVILLLVVALAVHAWRRNKISGIEKQ